MPVEAHGNGRDSLRRILYNGDLAAIGADQAGGSNPKLLIGIQPLVIVEGAEIQGILGQGLHGFRGWPWERGDCGMIQVDQPFGDGELVPVEPPERLCGDCLRRIFLFETH